MPSLEEGGREDTQKAHRVLRSCFSWRQSIFVAIGKAFLSFSPQIFASFCVTMDDEFPTQPNLFLANALHHLRRIKRSKVQTTLIRNCRFCADLDLVLLLFVSFGAQITKNTSLPLYNINYIMKCGTLFQVMGLNRYYISNLNQWRI